MTQHSLVPNALSTMSEPAVGLHSGGSPVAVTEAFLDVLRTEADALALVSRQLAESPAMAQKACQIVMACRHPSQTGKRVIVSGIGKAGIVGRKVAATLSSTGTPAVFMHPVEALHGDLGTVCAGDAALCFSFSGETEEVVRFAQELRRLHCDIISITRTCRSRLGCYSDAVLEIGDVREACELGLAPSSTTTAMLAIGDALALAVAKASGFTAKDFAVNHPAGMLGLRFRTVAEFMRTGERLVTVAPTQPICDVVRRVSIAKTGAAIVVDSAGALLGIFTDGDLRRAILRGCNALNDDVSKYASIPCRFVHHDVSAAEALQLMQDTRIEDLPVVSGNDRQVSGLLCLKDIRS